MPQANLITDTQILILDVNKLRAAGMTIQEFVGLVQLGIYPMLDVYSIRDKGEALKELVEYSK